jgi:hypothetical protein
MVVGAIVWDSLGRLAFVAVGFGLVDDGLMT